MALNHQEECMMRAVVFTLFLLLCFSAASAQHAKTKNGLSEEQSVELENALNKENWVKSADLAAKFLKELKNEEGREVEVLRYIFIFASAGKVTRGKMSLEDLGKALNGFVGKTVRLPTRVLTITCRTGLNVICAKKGESDELFSAATNNAGTNMHAAEIIQLEKKIDLTGREGSPVVVGGRIKAIEPNPRESRIFIMWLYIENGFIEFPDS
jgi:hypothetical protein